MNRKRIFAALALILTIIAIDQISKELVISSMDLGETIEPIPALVPYFQFTRSANTGSAFGFLPEAGDIFLVLALVIVAGMLYYFPRIPNEAWITQIATAMICGGALGNAIDRLRHEHVVDFIHYRIPDVVSNVSNLADHAIVLGVALIIYDSWRLERREKRTLQSLGDETHQP